MRSYINETSPYQLPDETRDYVRARIDLQGREVVVIL